MADEKESLIPLLSLWNLNEGIQRFVIVGMVREGRWLMKERTESGAVLGVDFVGGFMREEEEVAGDGLLAWISPDFSRLLLRGPRVRRSSVGSCGGRRGGGVATETQLLVEHAMKKITQLTVAFRSK